MIANIFWCIFTTMTQTTSITNVLVIIKNHLHFITTWFSSEIIDIIFYAFQTKRTVNLSIFIDYFILYFKIAIIVAHIIWWDSFLIYQKMKWDYKIITMNKKKILVILNLKRQRSPETTANTQDESTCKMFIFWNIYRCKSTILSRSTTMTNDRDMTTTVSQLLNFKTAMRGLRAKIIIFFIPYAVWITASC